MGDWASEFARIINERLKSPYHLVTDWSHLGFDRYREGVAILSRHPIARQEGRYVSNSCDPYSIHSRKVVMAGITGAARGAGQCLLVPFELVGRWFRGAVRGVFVSGRRMSTPAKSAATMLCGDFNIKAGSRGYHFVVDSNEYDDQYLAVSAPRFPDDLRCEGLRIGTATWTRSSHRLRVSSQGERAVAPRPAGKCSRRRTMGECPITTAI